MASPVRLRGEVGERRRKDAPEYPVPGFYLVSSSRDADGLGWGKVSAMCQRLADRRTSPSIAARVDECIAIAKAPLLRVIEEQAKEIERLKLQLNQHMDEVVHLTGAVEHRDKEIANLCHVMTYDPAKLAAGAGAGEVAGE